MKKSIALISAASTLFLAGCSTMHEHDNAKWEYKTIVNASDAELNQLAEQDWKVVNFCVTNPDGNPTKYILLKKLKQ